MEMIYDRLNRDELTGTTQADHLISLDAVFSVVINDETVHTEPRFPVVELARSLRLWLENPGRGDFEFDSMSIEEVGSVAFRQTTAGWTYGSAFHPVAPPHLVDWAEIEQCCCDLVSRVAADLAELGLDPAEVLKR